MQGDGGPAGDRHLLVSWAALGLGLIGITMAWSVVVGPWLLGSTAWYIARDAWVPVPAAHFVAGGALPLLYEATQPFLSLPGLAIALAPVAAAVDLMGLSESVPFELRHPSAWLVLGPYGAALSSVALLEVRRLASFVGVVRDRFALQVAVLVVALIPVVTVWGHYEDAVALAGVLAGVRLMGQERWRGAAVALGLAILFKQWAALMLPMLVLQSPAGKRGRTALTATAIPGAFLAACLLGSLRATVDAVVLSPSFPQHGHRQLWLLGGLDQLVATPLRAIPLVVAGALAWRLRDDRRTEVLAAALALSFAARMVVEPSVHSYYLAPAFTLALVVDAGRGGRWVVPAAAACLLDLLFMAYPPPVLWWTAAVVLGAVALRPAWSVLRAGLSPAVPRPVPLPR